MNEPHSASHHEDFHEPQPVDDTALQPDEEAPPTPEEEASEASDPADEPAAQTRWQTRWNIALIALAFVAMFAVTRWVTWRQAVAYQPPLEMSALTTPAPEVSAIPAATVAITPAPKRILVHIVGRVKKPGVFEMASGARLKDALHLAGGPLPNADLEAINLAEPVEDGQQYRVPARQEAIASATRTAPQVLAAPPKMASRTPRSARTSTESSSRVPEPKAVISATPAPIDINRATLEELQNLPGVGPATAQKIIEYRDEIGGFKSVDDLDGVKGIGPKKLEKMRPFALVR